MACTDSQHDELTYVVCDPTPYPPPVLEDEEDQKSKTSKEQDEEKEKEPNILDMQEKPTVIIRYG